MFLLLEAIYSYYISHDRRDKARVRGDALTGVSNQFRDLRFSVRIDNQKEAEEVLTYSLTVLSECR